MTDALFDVAVALAIEFGRDPGSVRSLGGATGLVWGVGEHVMRIGSGEQLDREEAVVASAAGFVPVPAVVDRRDRADLSAVLIERMPGTAGWSEGMSERVAERRGEALGLLHERIGRATAPPDLEEFRPDGEHRRLMHFDLHPFNVLFGEDDEVTGVIDWANARSGTVEGDRARTAAILFFDPTARDLATHASWRAFVRGWRRTAPVGAVSTAELTRAIEYLIADLSWRHSAAELAPARQALQDLHEGRLERVYEY